MMRTRSPLPGLEPLLEEHSQLWKAVELCRSTLNGKYVAAHYLNSLFQKLLEQILNHFSNEEEHGYFVDVIEEAPQLEPAVEELCRQHPRMVKLIVGILKVLEDEDSGEERRSDLIRKYAEFYHLFEHHEAEETRLLQNAFNRDIGSHD